MERFFSRKYAKVLTINAIAKILNDSVTDSNKKNQLIVHTAAGTYYGTLREFQDFEDAETKEGDDIPTCYHKLYLSTLNNFNKSTTSKENTVFVEENPISIELENVKLVTSSNTFEIPFVSIFVDQIIGLSLGSLN